MEDQFLKFGLGIVWRALFTLKAVSLARVTRVGESVWKKVIRQIYTRNIDRIFGSVGFSSVMMAMMSCLESNETWLFFLDFLFYGERERYLCPLFNALLTLNILW